MKILEVGDRTPLLLEQLLDLWERSVRATHRFLSENEIAGIRREVPQALKGVAHLAVAKAEGPAGFLGAEGRRLEMLFLAPEARRKGLGRKLLQFGIQAYGVNEVTVNEQNPQALGFYEHMGFRVVRRTDQDEQGRPYPLLYLRRDGSPLIP